MTTSSAVKRWAKIEQRKEVQLNQASDLSEAIALAKMGQQSMVKCLHHDDGTGSVHVAPGTTHPVLITCHAGCTFEQILTAAGVDVQETLADRDPNDITAQNEWTPGGPASHIYTYADENGELLFEVLRAPQPGGGKKFFQRHRDSNERSGWKWSMQGVRRILYRLPEVCQAVSNGHTVYVVEGEKDVETVRGLGCYATTSPMGAGKWNDEYSQSLAGARVVIISDADTAGRNHARSVRESLIRAGCSVSICEPKEGCKDVTDHVRAGGTLETLIETVPEAEDKRGSYGVDVLTAIKRVFEQKSFVIPQVLARGDRLLVTGFEGHGKSTLLRQMAVQCAAGIHPWTNLPMPPQKVLVIDVENHPDQTLESWQQLVGLVAHHGSPMQEGQLTILEEWDNDIDLCSEEGYAWMMERIHAYKPDILFMGPLYNMANKDLKDDETVRKLKRVVNDGRAICGTAFVMEHHAPHKGPGDKERSVRPYGSSTFLKWPDFGFGLRPTETEGVYEWQKTRFPRVRSRHFPAFVRWGKVNSAEFPWMEAMQDDAGNVY